MMLIVVVVLAVMFVWSVLALCAVAKRGELRAAVWARRADVAAVAAGREREQHLRAAMARHPSSRSRRTS